MEISGKRMLIIGAAGLIGSYTVDELVKEDVAEIRIYDNFTQGQLETGRRDQSDKGVVW
jgi:UDP-glucose 4-epimerase